MATIVVDGRTHEADPNENLLHVCLSLGYDLPYFCWHPAMGSVGACRQCAVKQFRDEKDARGRLVMACMTPAADGTRISIQDPDAVAFRASVIEWLMVNHPHDCPVCDEGGECHLQDMTVMTGHVYREFRFKKRTYRNQYLGPLVNHEMNRCIQCYRCVRFYREYAGGRDLDVFGAHDQVYFGRHEDGVLQSEFSGNLVEVCPTGVFTDKTLKQHYTRKWDLQTAPSVCVHCGVGCNTLPGERYGSLRRIVNGYNREVNGYFLCDRGRYGYEFVNHEHRIRQPLARMDGRLAAVSEEAALGRAAEFLAEGRRVIGIGSPRASLEANFLLRALVGPDCFFAGLSEAEARLVSTAIEALRRGPAPSPSLHEIETADVAFVLGEDLTNTAPMIALALRQTVRQKPMRIARGLKIPLWHDAAVREAVQDEMGPLFIASPAGTKLDDVAAGIYRGAPDDLARLGFAVAHALDGAAPGADIPEEGRDLAEAIARALLDAERPVVISGTGLGSPAVMQAAANVAWALYARGCPAALCFAVPECNSLGLGLMAAGDMRLALDELKGGEVEALIVLENDLYRRGEAAFVDELLAAARHVIVVDHLENRTTAGAGVVLPAATFAEGDGTLVNNEGRAQRFYQVFVPEGEIRESWRWLRDLMVAAQRPEATWQNFDEVAAAMARAMPQFAPAAEIGPRAGFRIAGQRVPRQPHRYSGRTAMTAHLTVHEPKPPDDPDTPLSFSMEGFKGRPPGALAARYWAPGWNSWAQALTKFQTEVAGPLAGDDPGRRLIEPAEAGAADYFREVPRALEPHPGEWLIVPLHHIFGSEELSILSPWIAELAPDLFVALHPEDARDIGVGEGESVTLGIGRDELRLPIQLRPSLPRGIAGLPVGLPGMPWIGLPARGRLRPVSSDGGLESRDWRLEIGNL